MNKKLLLLVAGVLATLGSNAMAANTNQILGDLNKTQFLNNSNVIGNSNEAEGENNNVIGDHNDVSGYSSIAIGNHIDLKDHLYSDINKSYSLSPKGKGNIAIGDHTKAEVAASTAIGYLAQSWGDASVAVGAYSMAFDDVHKVDEKYAGVKTTQGVFSIGNSNYFTTYDQGTTPERKFKIFTRQLQNVGAGEISATSTDAVNGSQLYDVLQEAKNHTVVVSGDDNIVVDSDEYGTYTVSTNKNLKAETLSLNDGNNESHYTTEGVSMTHRGDGTEPEYHTTYNYNGIRIATNDGNTEPIDEITLTTDGLNNGGKKITNVSRGEKDTDAVNVGQLKEVGNKVNDNSKRIDTNEKRINDLDNKINDVGRNALERANHYTDLQVNKGVAKASALAGLKYLDYNPKDKWSFAASVGHYRNANAIAVGAAYQPNENTMVHGGITVDGKVAYNLGVSFKTGGQKQVTRHELEEQIRQLENNNIRMQEELNEIRAMLEKK